MTPSSDPVWNSRVWADGRAGPAAPRLSACGTRVFGTRSQVEVCQGHVTVTSDPQRGDPR